MGEPRVLEVRVHGIANAPPADMLLTEPDGVVKAEGDALGSFWQRKGADTARPRSGLADHRVEAYSWGNQARTGGSALALVGRAFVHLGWLFILPFALCNLAYWSRRSIPGPTEHSVPPRKTRPTQETGTERRRAARTQERRLNGGDRPDGEAAGVGRRPRRDVDQDLRAAADPLLHDGVHVGGRRPRRGAVLQRGPQARLRGTAAVDRRARDMESHRALGPAQHRPDPPVGPHLLDRPARPRRVRPGSAQCGRRRGRARHRARCRARRGAGEGPPSPAPCHEGVLARIAHRVHDGARALRGGHRARAVPAGLRRARRGSCHGSVAERIGLGRRRLPRPGHVLHPVARAGRRGRPVAVLDGRRRRDPAPGVRGDRHPRGAERQADVDRGEACARDHPADRQRGRLRRLAGLGDLGVHTTAGRQATRRSSAWRSPRGCSPPSAR